MKFIVVDYFSLGLNVDKGANHRVDHDMIHDTWPMMLVISPYRDSAIINVLFDHAMTIH